MHARMRGHVWAILLYELNCIGYHPSRVFCSSWRMLTCMTWHAWHAWRAWHDMTHDMHDDACAHACACVDVYNYLNCIGYHPSRVFCAAYIMFCLSHVIQASAHRRCPGFTTDRVLPAARHDKTRRLRRLLQQSQTGQLETLNISNPIYTHLPWETSPLMKYSLYYIPLHHAYNNITLHYIKSHHTSCTTPHITTPYHTTHHHTTLHHTTSHHTTPHITTPHHNPNKKHITTHQHTTHHHTIPHHTSPHHISPHHTTTNHTSPHITTPHITIPHHTSHHTTLHRTRNLHLIPNRGSKWNLGTILCQS